MGAKEVQIHSFLNFALDQSELSASDLGPCTSGMWSPEEVHLYKWYPCGGL